MRILISSGRNTLVINKIIEMVIGHKETSDLLLAEVRLHNSKLRINYEAGLLTAWHGKKIVYKHVVELPPIDVMHLIHVNRVPELQSFICTLIDINKVRDLVLTSSRNGLDVIVTGK